MVRDADPRWLHALDARLTALPPWARPPFYGVLAVAVLIAGRACFVWPLLVLNVLIGGPDALLWIGWLLVVAGAAGFAGGVAFGASGSRGSRAASARQAPNDERRVRGRLLGDARLRRRPRLLSAGRERGPCGCALGDVHQRGDTTAASPEGIMVRQMHRRFGS